MKALKIVSGVVIALALIIIVVVVVGLQNINKIVKVAVETVGTDIAQTEVGLSKVDIQVKEGRGELNGLTVANPKGFSNNNIFTLGKVVLAVDPKSLLGDVKVIDEITISSINILAEHKGVKDTNLQALFDNLKSSSNGPGDQSSSAPEESVGEQKQVLLAVKKVVFADNSVSLSSEEFGDSQFTIPSFELANLGSKEQGLTPNELALELLKPLVSKAAKKVRSEIEDELKGKLEEKALDKLDDDQKDKLNKLKSLFD